MTTYSLGMGDFGSIGSSTPTRPSRRSLQTNTYQPYAQQAQLGTAQRNLQAFSQPQQAYNPYQRQQSGYQTEPDWATGQQFGYQTEPAWATGQQFGYQTEPYRRLPDSGAYARDRMRVQQAPQVATPAQLPYQAPTPNPYAVDYMTRLHQDMSLNGVNTFNPYAQVNQTLPTTMQAPGYAQVTTAPYNPYQQAPGSSTIPNQDLEAYRSALPAPNQIVARNWMRLPKSSQEFLLGTYEALGYDPDDVEEAVQRTTPTWRVPRYGTVRM
jgi:hypothetical protein